jgi:winged helix-turn-helix DNA-binding protein
MTEPRILPGCSVLSPMEPLRPRTTSTNGKPTAKRTKQTADRFAALNAFADFTLRDLDRAEVAVWLLLWRDTKADGLAKTSQADLARRAGIAERTARRAVDRLERAGLLTVVHRGGLRRGVSTYRVRSLSREPP